MTMNVSVICLTDQTREALAAAVAALPDIAFNVYSGSSHTLASVLHKDKPQLALLEFPAFEDTAMAEVRKALQESPDTRLVLVSPERSIDFLMQAMRMGVREVLPAPLSFVSVQDAIQHEKERQAGSGSHDDNPRGRVLAVIPAKGGAGATFLSTNLAFALSRQGRRVAVLDLDLNFGDAAIYLGDSTAKSTIVDLARKADEMDRALLESSMVKISDRLHILMAPESPDHLDVVSAAALEKIIDLARSSYDFVVLDCGSTFDAQEIKALDLADSIHLVVQLTLPFVRAAKRIVEVFRELGYSNEKLNVVISRYEKGGDVTQEDVEKATLLKVAHTIPNSHVAVTASINQGIPLLELMPRDPVAHALQAWAQELAPAAQGAKDEGGWLHHLMRGGS